MATSGIVTADKTVGTDPNLVDILQPDTELRLTIGSLVSQVMRAKSEPMGIFVQFGSVRKVHFMRSVEGLPLIGDFVSLDGGSVTDYYSYHAELSSNASKAYGRALAAPHNETLIEPVSDVVSILDNQLLAAVKPRLSLAGVLSRAEEAEQYAIASDLMVSGEHLCMYVDQRRRFVHFASLRDDYVLDLGEFSVPTVSTAELISTVSVGGTPRSVGGVVNEGYFESGVAQPVA